jgi:hypothetical protein
VLGLVVVARLGVIPQSPGRVLPLAKQREPSLARKRLQVSWKLLNLVTHRTSGGCLHKVTLELALGMLADGIGEHLDRLRRCRRFLLGGASRLWFDGFAHSRLLADRLPSAHDSLVLGLVFMQSRDGGLYGGHKEFGGRASACD